MKTIIEPFKIKSVEPLKFTSLQERKRILKDAGYHFFWMPAALPKMPILSKCANPVMKRRPFVKSPARCFPMPTAVP